MFVVDRGVFFFNFHRTEFTQRVSVHFIFAHELRLIGRAVTHDIIKRPYTMLDIALLKLPTIDDIKINGTRHLSFWCVIYLRQLLVTAKGSLRSNQKH